MPNDRPCGVKLSGNFIGGLNPVCTRRKGHDRLWSNKETHDHYDGEARVEWWEPRPGMIVRLYTW